MSSTSSVSESHTIPRHIAIIMDGNGRWASRQGLPRVAGHRKGVQSVRDTISACADHGVRYLTLFAFSSENWRRPQREVSLLMDLFLSALEKEVGRLHENNIQFRVIGDVESFGKKLVTRIREAEELTRNNDKLTVIVAANYGGRWDVARACKRIAQQVKDGNIDPETIAVDTLEPYLSLYGVPEPDLFIRTGGEQRISNFLLWQLAYTEMYFTDSYWPEFNNEQFEKALDVYALRQRRFGLTGDQVGNTNA
ncbi:MAG: isoprenyl transferase [Proteobacteria bacterium]|nr:isoprenyl transferase [Pseudomonadota bacterium]